MAGQLPQPIKVMTEYSTVRLKQVQVAIKRHNIKTPNGKPLPLERILEDPESITDIVHCSAGPSSTKLFHSILPNQFAILPCELTTNVSAQASIKAKRSGSAPSGGCGDKPQRSRSRGRSESYSSDEEYRKNRSHSREKYKKAEEDKTNRRSADRLQKMRHENKESPNRFEKAKQSPSPSSSKYSAYRHHSRSRSRISTSRSRSSTSGSLSPPLFKRRSSRRSRSPRASGAAVRNLSSKPGVFRPDKGHSTRHRDRQSTSRSPSPSYCSRRRSRDKSPRHKRKHSRSSSHAFFDLQPTHLRPHLRADPLRYQYPTHLPYFPAPIQVPYLQPRFFGEPMYYRPRRPLPLYNNRPIPKFVTVTVTAGTTTNTDTTALSSTDISTSVVASTTDYSTTANCEY